MQHVIWQWLMPEPIADDNLAYMRTLVTRIVLISLVMSTVLLIVGIYNRLMITTPAVGLACGVSGVLFWFAR